MQNQYTGLSVPAGYCPDCHQPLLAADERDRLRSQLTETEGKLAAAEDAYVKAQSYAAGVIERQDNAYRELSVERDQLKRERDEALAALKASTELLAIREEQIQDFLHADGQKQLLQAQGECERLREALKHLLDEYVSLVDAMDLPRVTEDDPEVKIVRAALAPGGLKRGEAMEKVCKIGLAWLHVRQDEMEYALGPEGRKSENYIKRQDYRNRETMLFNEMQDALAALEKGE